MIRLPNLENGYLDLEKIRSRLLVLTDHRILLYHYDYVTEGLKLNKNLKDMDETIGPKLLETMDKRIFPLSVWTIKHLEISEELQNIQDKEVISVKLTAKDGSDPKLLIFVEPEHQESFMKSFEEEKLKFTQKKTEVQLPPTPKKKEEQGFFSNFINPFFACCG